MNQLPATIRRLCALAAALAADLLACAALLLLAARAAWAEPSAAVRPYPGAAPCNTGLQTCLDGANDGDPIVTEYRPFLPLVLRE